MDSKIEANTNVFWLTVVRYKNKKGNRFYEIGDKLFKTESEAIRYASELCNTTIYKIPKINKKSIEIGAKPLSLAQLENS